MYNHRCYSAHSLATRSTDPIVPNTDTQNSSYSDYSFWLRQNIAKCIIPAATNLSALIVVERNTNAIGGYLSFMNQSSPISSFTAILRDHAVFATCRTIACRAEKRFKYPCTTFNKFFGLLNPRRCIFVSTFLAFMIDS